MKKILLALTLLASTSAFSATKVVCERDSTAMNTEQSIARTLVRINSKIKSTTGVSAPSVTIETNGSVTICVTLNDM